MEDYKNLLYKMDCDEKTSKKNSESKHKSYDDMDIFDIHAFFDEPSSYYRPSRDDYRDLLEAQEIHNLNRKNR